ncbi:MAG: tetratricopeptide repeat protein [Polyangiaceae bacterium]
MPDDADLALALASAYEALRAGEAAPLLAVAARARPDDAALALRLSAAEAAAGRYSQAAAAHERAVALGLRDAPTYVDLGKLHERGGQHEAALRAFQEAYRLEPTNVRTIRRVAGTMHTLGRTAEAVVWLQGACRIDARDPGIRWALGMCYVALGKREEARGEYEMLQRLDPNLAQKLYEALMKQ